MATKTERVRETIKRNGGVLRLTPTWVPRSFCIPGKRLKLHPDDYYSFGAHRGGIDERWFSSTTHADNGPGTLDDEGLSYIYTDPDGPDASAPGRVLLLEAIEEIGDEILAQTSCAPTVDGRCTASSSTISNRCRTICTTPMRRLLWSDGGASPRRTTIRSSSTTSAGTFPTPSSASTRG
jgi:hypothetical protein